MLLSIVSNKKNRATVSLNRICSLYDLKRFTTSKFWICFFRWMFYGFYQGKSPFHSPPFGRNMFGTCSIRIKKQVTPRKSRRWQLKFFSCASRKLGENEPNLTGAHIFSKWVGKKPPTRNDWACESPGTPRICRHPKVTGHFEDCREGRLFGHSAHAGSDLSKHKKRFGSFVGFGANGYKPWKSKDWYVFEWFFL